jgi:hypothetical protein
MAAFLALAPLAYPCTWVRGYFYRVTRLRGKVVGVNRGDLRQISRWLRQRVVRDDAKLTLYEYRGTWDRDETRVIKRVDTDRHGNFDFGALPDGHYTLYIGAPWWDDYFDVQIVQLPRRTAFVIIDISPVYPDCTGGHEFIAASE